MSIPLSLSGKVALISGGSRGIGAATVRMFAAAGAKVAFSYRSARSQAEALAKECGAAVCHPIASDLKNPEAARALVAETVRAFWSTRHSRRQPWRLAARGRCHRAHVGRAMALHHVHQSRRSVRPGQTRGRADEVATAHQRSGRTHRADQFHQRPARRSFSLRLFRDQGRADQHDQGTRQPNSPRQAST